MDGYHRPNVSINLLPAGDLSMEFSMLSMKFGF